MGKGTTEKVSQTKAFECDILRFEHESEKLRGLKSTYSVIVPPKSTVRPMGLLIWLSGLTCTDENFILKAGGAQYSRKYNIMIACPDTSPRGAGAPGEDDDWDFGTGAGFYVDATEPGFENYQMSSYIIDEFIPLILSQFSQLDKSRVSLSGHSMGGMGALQLGIRFKDMFKSVSAFAPVANPTLVPWGQKCFTGYLGNEMATWKDYDPCELIRKHGACYDNILLEQGSADSFLETQLLPDNFVSACNSAGQRVSFSFLFISSNAYSVNSTSSDAPRL